MDMNFCSKGFINMYQFIGVILKLLKLFIPLIIIVIGTYDLFQAVISNEDKSLKKKVGMLIRRIVIGVLIFFLPTIILFLFEMINVEQNSFSCVYTCVLDTGKCNSIINDIASSSSNNDSICSNFNEEQCNEKSECLWVDMTQFGEEFINPQTNNYHCTIK